MALAVVDVVNDVMAVAIIEMIMIVNIKITTVTVAVKNITVIVNATIRIITIVTNAITTTDIFYPIQYGGQKRAHSRGQNGAHSRGQNGAHSRGQNGAHSRGQTTWGKFLGRDGGQSGQLQNREVEGPRSAG